MNKLISLVIILLAVSSSVLAQDTILVQTFTYDSTSRRAMFDFPSDPNLTFEKILMEYSMRCHDAAVGNGQVGCGEWDYSCNTVLTDPATQDSARATHPSHVISNFGGETFDYTTVPTFAFELFEQKEVDPTDFTIDEMVQVGDGTEVMNSVLNGESLVSKSQFLYKGEELSDLGLNAGLIQGIQLESNGSSSVFNFMKIKMKHTEKEFLIPNEPDINGFQEVYFLNGEFNSDSNTQEFFFYEPFDWDGSSNIIFEISYTNNLPVTSVGLVGSNTAYVSGIVSNQNNFAAKFNGSQFLDCPTDNFDSIEDEITISFWTKGNKDVLPINSTIFEGVDTNGLRQANVHLPWNNSNIYWDCGNDGSGYDRINTGATEDEIKGQWNHWAFVKHASDGFMGIYFNGELWHDGLDRTKMIDIHKFVMGGNVNMASPHYGLVDEFRVWDKALTTSEVKEFMHKKVDESHPYYENLVAYYDFVEGEGSVTQDQVDNGQVVEFSGVASWANYRGNELLNGFEESLIRPNLTFISGEGEPEVSNVLVLDSVQNTPSQVLVYEVEANNLIGVDTMYLYQAGEVQIFNEFGFVIDSRFFPIEGTIDIETLTFYNRFDSRYEVVSFVTPYGNGLDLGQDGKMWTFDVTDLGPVLKGQKELSVELGGAYQEELDIRFVYIVGEPARDIVAIQNIWPILGANTTWSGFSYSSLADDSRMETRQVLMNPDAEAYKIKVAQTGHGQNGEFIPRIHFLNLHGGDKELTWSGWKECSENPVYPQGGTWIYDRAGWCPGMATDIIELEITDMVEPGELVELDYGINQVGNMSEANYRVSAQLVSYGPPNFTLDASILEVQRPSTRTEFDRYNPICSNPIIVLQNRGSETLESVNIIYQVEGGGIDSILWEGDLDFLETEEVVLPISDPYFFKTDESDADFYVGLKSPNNGQDQYCQNDTYRSRFKTSDVIDEEVIIINIKTNSLPNTNGYSVTNQDGEIILESETLSANTIYNDELDIVEDGCYSVYLYDNGDDGLSFWNNPSQGNGYFRLARENGNNIKTFNADFGGFLAYNFAIYQDAPNNPDPEPLAEIFAVDSLCVFVPTIDTMEIDTMDIDTMDIDTMMVDTMDIDTMEIDTMTAINELPYRLFRTYPNPAGNQVWVELHAYHEREIQIELYNAMGQMILRESFYNESLILKKNIDLSKYDPGLYYIKLYDGDKMRVKELIKN